MALRPAKALLFATLLAFLFGTSWMARELYHPHPATGSETVFRLEKGLGANAILRSLGREKIVRSPAALIAAYRLFYSEESLKAGQYRFEFPASGKDVLVRVFRGGILLHPFTVPEGLTARETGDLLGGRLAVESASFESALGRTELIADLDPRATDLEGYLFPDTYFFPEEAGAGDIVEAMVDEFRRTFGEEWRLRAAGLGMEVREIVILASLIEKETGRAEERPLVSAVFHNRLRIGMKLDCDPTILYALKLEGRTVTRLLTKDLKNPSPYNTYLHRGLPPGPICNPGRPALEAALHPADEDYLYFVSRNDGTHVFSRTFRDHQNAVQRYQLKKK
jgi:UPF0755 protein